jgi:hypothetical protein
MSGNGLTRAERERDLLRQIQIAKGSLTVAPASRTAAQGDLIVPEMPPHVKALKQTLAVSTATSPAAKPRPAVPGATPKRAVVTAYCTEAQREYFVSFRFNARAARFFVSAKTKEPPEQADRSIPLALLPLSTLICLYCRNPLQQSTCNFRPTLVCMPVPGDDCPGFCRNLFGLG